MAITSIDDIVNGLTFQKRVNVLKTFPAAKAASALVSGWLGTGLPSSGSSASAYTLGFGYTYDNTSSGALGECSSLGIKPAVNKNWMTKMIVNSSQQGVLVIADRLWSCSGMGFAAGGYTVVSPGSLPARITDNGVDCELWVESYIAAGAASGTLSAVYLDTTGVSATGTMTPVSAPTIGQIQYVNLSSADLGVKQLTSVFITNTWTSGSFGMTIRKRLVEIPITQASIPLIVDWAQLGLVEIVSNACLELIWCAVGTTAVTLQTTLIYIDA